MNAAPVTRTLICGGRVYDHDGDIHQPERTDVLIAGGLIERVGPDLPADGSMDVIDAAGRLIVPGFRQRPLPFT